MKQGLSVLSITVHQYRKLYIAAGVYLAILAVAGLVVEKPTNEAVTALLGVPFSAVILQILVAFINPDADLAGAGSHYPALLLRLPVRTQTLALWPMIAGSLWAGAAWLVYAGLFMLPRGVNLPLLWPAVGLMSVVLSMQALMWTPFRYGAVRLLLILAIPTLLISSGIAFWEAHMPEPMLAALLGLAGVIAGSFAWIGVVRARTAPSVGGSSAPRSMPLSFPTRLPIALPTRASRPAKQFRSPLQAQVWMEWRVQGRMLPIITGVILVLFSIPLLLDGTALTPVSHGQIRPWIFTMLAVFPWIPVVLATFVGMGARKPNMRNGDGAYHLFYATRPLYSSDIIRAKVIAFTLGTLVSWAMTLGVMLLWLLLPAKLTWGPDVGITSGYSNGISSTGLAVLTSGFETHQWQLAGFSLLALIGFTWRNQLVGAFVDYVPYRWVVIGYPLLVVLVGAYVFTWISVDSSALRVESVDITVLAAGLVVLTAKMAAALVTGLAIVRKSSRDLLSVLTAAGAWLAGSIVVCGLLSWLASQPEFASTRLFAQPVPVLAGLILVPIFRPLLARYALEVGRHR